MITASTVAIGLTAAFAGPATVVEEVGPQVQRLQVGDRVIVGSIKERKEAKVIYEQAKADGKKKFQALIVAPTSVVTNWERELDKFSPSLKHIVWHGGDRKERTDELEDADVVITSYALLRRDEELLAKLDLTYAILDEAQNIKNPLSATARSAKRLKSQRRLALTGTPIENRLSEIWSIFDFVSPGLRPIRLALRTARQLALSSLSNEEVIDETLSLSEKEKEMTDFSWLIDK